MKTSMLVPRRAGQGKSRPHSKILEEKVNKGRRGLEAGMKLCYSRSRKASKLGLPFTWKT